MRILLSLLLVLVLFSCSKKDQGTLKKEKKENKIIKKEEKTIKKSSLEDLNSKLDKENVLLANQDKIYYESSKTKWEVEDFNFSVYEMAYDSKKSILVGMNKKQDILKAVNIKTGKLIWKKRINLKNPEKLEEEPGKVEKIGLGDTEAKADNSSVSFAYDDISTIIAAVNKVNKNKKYLYDLNYYGIDIRTGKIKWSRVLQKGNPKWPYPINWIELGWTLWSQNSVVLLGDVEKGPLYIIDSKNGEWYDIKFPRDTDPYKLSFAGIGKERIYFFKYGKEGFALKAVDKLDGSDDNKYAWEKNYPCRLRKGFFVGKEIQDYTFLCSKYGKNKQEYKLSDYLIKFDPKTGNKVWESKIEDRIPNGQSQKDMIYSKLSKDKKNIYVRSLFYLAKINLKSGKLLWKYKLNPEKVDGVFADYNFFHHQWVLGGDEPYDSYILLDDKDGKVIFTMSNKNKSAKNRNPGMPASAYMVKNYIVSYGDRVIKIYDKNTKKEIWTHVTKDKIESLYLANDIFYLETMGIRKGFKLPNFEIWSWDRTKSETLLNNGWMKNLSSELLLFNEEDFILKRLELLNKSSKKILSNEKIAKADILTKEERFNSLEFSKDDKYIYFSMNDKDLEQRFKIEVQTKKITKLEDFEKNNYKIISKREKKELTIENGKKKTKTVDKYYLKTKDNKKIKLTDNNLEYYKFDDKNEKIFLVEADNQYYLDEVDYKDLIFKVYDIKNNKFYNFLTIRKIIAKLRRKINAGFVRYGDFGPNNTVSFTIENMNNHKGLYTMNYLKKNIELLCEINVDDGELKFDFPKKYNLSPSSNLSFQETDFNHSFYEFLDWGRFFLALGENFTLKYSSPKKNGFSVFSDLISNHSWNKNGFHIALNSGGNIYIYNIKTKKLNQVSYFLPKREPKNLEDTVFGNSYRIKSLAFSNDGKQLAIALNLPKEKLRRIIILNIEKYLK